MAIREISQDGIILARHIPSEDAWKDGLSFFSENEEFIQAGTWGYDAGKELKAHAHNLVTREVLWTQEVLYIRRGRVRAEVYNLQDEKIDELIGGSGDVMILLRGGHGYEILEDGTQVLEVKNGPYVGADADRRRF
jgi:hypothetical protein